MSDNYIYPKIDRLRRKLLDLGRANPLINPRLTAKSKKVFRLVNDQAQLILRCLANQCHLRFKALPPLDLIPPEETTEAFQKAMTLARLTDSDYLASLVKLNDLEPAQASLEEEKLERALKDRVRDSLGLKPSAPQKTPTCQEHAEKHGLNPDYDLPATTLKTLPKPKDRDIQTLFWPEEFDRKLKGLMDECRRMEEETGVNSLKVIFGFLDWIDENHESYFSPLTMTQARLEKKSGRRGLEYLIYADDDDCEVNFVLAEKLRLERGLELPELTLGEDGTPDLELFFQEISEIAPPNIKWRVRRQVAVGVFPSSGMNMYEDLAEDKHDFERLPLIKKFFGGFASGPEMFAADYNLEDNLADNQLSDLVLDADVSQSSTLIDLRAGRDLAVEGPPGSGKSQTIVNAIAGALFENKTVLFVAEKMAALEVVKSRLEAIGLGEFLLPLQVQRSTRQQVIQSIRTRCFMSPPKLNSDLALAPRGYRENRDILKDYVKFIGQVFGQTELTFYDLVGWALNRLAILDKAPEAFKKPPFMEGAPNWSKADLAEIVSAAKDTAKAYQEADASPWRHLELVSQVSHFEVEEILKLAEKAAEALTITEGWRRDLSFGLGEKPASELIKLESFWRAFSQLSAGLNQNFLVWVLEDKNYPVARYYYERIATYRQNAQSLTASLVGASPKEANDLATLLALGQKENLKTFDLKVLEAEIIAEETRLATLAQLLASQKKSGAWLKIVGFSSLEASDPVVLRQKIASAATELERLTALIERFMAQRKALAFLGLNSLDQVELKTLAADLAVAEKELENLHSLLERYAALDQILQRRSLSWAELEPASLKITLAKTTE
ncbi:MAG: DUF4011 domain-containing protein, partial [Deltaproteobacteria bacterium]|nr:DUF4011 domain-containing protein [Deltaproteobacteria bacterium]